MRCAALARADVGIGLALDRSRPPWSADIILGEDLRDALCVTRIDLAFLFDPMMAIHTVAAKITAPPSKVVPDGTSANTSQPISEAHTRSRNFTDCVDEMSAARNERVRQ